LVPAEFAPFMFAVPGARSPEGSLLTQGAAPGAQPLGGAAASSADAVLGARAQTAPKPKPQPPTPPQAFCGEASGGGEESDEAADQHRSSDAKYHDQLQAAWLLLQTAIGSVTRFDELLASAGSAHLRDLLEHPRSVQLQDIETAQQCLDIVTSLCQQAQLHVAAPDEPDTRDTQATPSGARGRLKQPRRRRRSRSRSVVRERRASSASGGDDDDLTLHLSHNDIRELSEEQKAQLRHIVKVHDTQMKLGDFCDPAASGASVAPVFVLRQIDQPTNRLRVGC